MKIRKIICLALIGQITSNEKLDVSNIKIDILSSKLDFDEDDVLIYANTYQYSVYTNKDGYYSFNKPSEKYLINVDTSTLPYATGLSTNSLFMGTDNKIPVIEMSKITDISICGEDSIILYNQNNEEIISNVVVDNATLNDSSRNAVLNNVTVNANGIVSSKIFRDDISKYSLLEKADILFDTKAITEEQKAEMYLEAYKTSDIGEIDCLTPIYDFLFDYYMANKGTVLANDINALLQIETITRAATSPYTFTTEGTLTTTIGSGGTAITYKIHYENSSTATCYMSNPSTVLNYVTDIATYYFSTYNFNRPLYETARFTQRNVR